MPSNRNVAIRVHPHEIFTDQRFTDVFLDFDIPARQAPRSGWRLKVVAHTYAAATCEGCGHHPSRRVFFFTHTTRNELRMLGSECAREWLRVDEFRLAINKLDRELSHRRRAHATMPVEIIEDLEGEEGFLVWALANPDVKVWLEAWTEPAWRALGGPPVHVRNIRLYQRQVASRSALTTRQTGAVRRRMAFATDAMQSHLANVSDTISSVPAIREMIHNLGVAAGDALESMSLLSETLTFSDTRHQLMSEVTGKHPR